jgi:hypothetical protein
VPPDTGTGVPITSKAFKILQCSAFR